MVILSPQAWNGYAVYGNQNGRSIFLFLWWWKSADSTLCSMTLSAEGGACASPRSVISSPAGPWISFPAQMMQYDGPSRWI